MKLDLKHYCPRQSAQNCRVRGLSVPRKDNKATIVQSETHRDRRVSKIASDGGQCSGDISRHEVFDVCFFAKWPAQTMKECILSWGRHLWLARVDGEKGLHSRSLLLAVLLQQDKIRALSSNRLWINDDRDWPGLRWQFCDGDLYNICRIRNADS